MIFTLYAGREFLVSVAAAILLNFLLTPVVRGLQRARVPQTVGAALVVVTFLAVSGAGIYWMAGPADERLRVWTVGGVPRSVPGHAGGDGTPLFPRPGRRVRLRPPLGLDLGLAGAPMAVPLLTMAGIVCNRIARLSPVARLLER